MIFDALRRWFGFLPGRSGSGGNGTERPGPEEGPEMIPCEEALARLYEYLDGELEAASREEVELHFRICARCYPHLKLETNYRDALRRALEGQRAPPGLRTRILELMEG